MKMTYEEMVRNTIGWVQRKDSSIQEFEDIVMAIINHSSIGKRTVYYKLPEDAKVNDDGYHYSIVSGYQLIGTDIDIELINKYIVDFNADNPYFIMSGISSTTINNVGADNVVLYLRMTDDFD
jgi:hypothetical protein